MIKNFVVLPELFFLLQKQSARGVLREYHVGIGRIVVPEDREGTLHRDVRTDRERQHLDGDVRQPAGRDETIELGAHYRSATHKAAEDRLIQHHPEIEWIILYQ